MPKPTQQPMFTAQDLPLFSGTAPRTHDSIFTPREPEPEQLPLPEVKLACTHPADRVRRKSAYAWSLGGYSYYFVCLACDSIIPYDWDKTQDQPNPERT